MMAGKTLLKVLIVCIAILLLLLLGAFLYVPTYINTKITTEVNNNTDFAIEIGTVSFTGISSLELRDIQLQHKLNRDDYIKSKGFQTDWISCKIGSFSICDIRWIQLFSDKNFFAEKIIIHSPDIYIFRDKRVPSKYKYVALPATLLREMKFPFTIPEISIDDGKVIYEETEKKTGKNITVPFNHLSATLRHMSSDPLYLLQQPEMLIEAKASLFDSVKTNITYTANTLNPNNVFTVEGILQTFSATLLNKCITPATLVMIDNGMVNRIHFKFTGNETVAKGTMNMDYSNLKLTILKKDKGDDKAGLKKSESKTFLANLFVRNKDKKEKDDNLKNILLNTPAANHYSGKIHFERRKDRSIFNYWWNSFKSGIASSVLKVPVEKIKK